MSFFLHLSRSFGIWFVYLIYQLKKNVRFYYYKALAIVCVRFGIKGKVDVTVNAKVSDVWFLFLIFWGFYAFIFFSFPPNDKLMTICSVTFSCL